MQHVSIKGNICTVKLNQVFYPPEAIKAGIEQFKDMCDIKEENGEVIITSDNAEELCYDFCDYLLSQVQRGI